MICASVFVETKPQSILILKREKSRGKKIESVRERCPPQTSMFPEAGNLRLFVPIPVLLREPQSWGTEVLALRTTD